MSETQYPYPASKLATKTFRERLHEQSGSETDTDQPSYFAMTVGIFVCTLTLTTILNFQEFNMIYLALLSLLAAIGVCALLGIGAGLIQVGQKRHNPSLVESYADHLSDGIVITKDKGDVVYANEAYFHILRQKRSRYVPSIESAFAGEPPVQDAIYRLSKAASEFRDWEEEIRIQSEQPSDATCSTRTTSQNSIEPISVGHRWLRISVRPIHPKKSGNAKKKYHLAHSRYHLRAKSART